MGLREVKKALEECVFSRVELNWGLNKGRSLSESCWLILYSVHFLGKSTPLSVPRPSDPIVNWYR